MGTFFKPFALAAGVCAMMFLADVPETMLGVSFVREAKAFVMVAHPPRPMAVVGAVAVTTAVVASSSARASTAAQANANAASQANQAAAQANQSAAQANQAAADAKAAAATAKQPPPGPPPVGTMVTTLPAGCSQTKLNNVDYLRCGSTYYKPALVGDTAVFVVSQP
jgi:type II secretory pathway pseudopilin PulG